MRSPVAITLTILAAMYVAFVPCTLAQLVQPESLPQGFVLVVEDKMRIASTESPILMASSHNGWNPNDPTQVLTRRSDGRWQIVRAKPSIDSKLSFKFTRGSWETSEVDGTLQEIENRLLPMVDVSKLAPNEAPVIELVIEQWKDQRPPEKDIHRITPYRELEVTGTVRRMETVLLSRSRDLLVWIPEGYDDPENADRRYPLVFMLDGQTAFEMVPAINGEWDADGVATRLIREGRITPPIIIAIPSPHAGPERIKELDAALNGSKFIDDVVNLAIPRIQRALRVTDDPALITGGGRAGVLAKDAAKRYPDTFGHVFAPPAENAAGVPFDPAWPKALEAEFLRVLAPKPRAAASRSPKSANLVRPESLSTGFVLVVTDRSGKASRENPIHLASNLGSWNPGDANAKLSARSDSKWQIEVPPPAGGTPLEFKFTLGSWDRVECSSAMGDISNRALALIDPSTIGPEGKPIIELVIEQFRDGASTPTRAADPYRTIPVAGGALRRLEVVGGAFPVRRELLVWVPPGYDEPANSQKTYPVLYLQDGQNIFAKSGVAPAEWGVDETALALIESGKVPPFIVVGIPSLDAHRMSEYVPFEGFDRADPKGDVYGRWLVTQVMPRVERAFRVRTDRESTFVGGSSLGAVISLSIGTEYADRIGGLLLESPSFLGEKSYLLDYVQSRPLTSARVYIGMGGQEFAQKAPSDSANLSMVKGAKSLAAIYASRPAGASSVMMTVVETHTHIEIAWAERLPKALEFLMGPNR